LVSSVANILLTGGRAPAALELARIFHAAGHQVFLAESVSSSLTANSCSVAASFLVPPPRQQPKDFIRALIKIICQNKIDLLTPTCEEAFHVARGHAELSECCTVFVEPLVRLRPLHNKWMFIQLAAELGLPVPKTSLIERADDLPAAFSRWPRMPSSAPNAARNCKRKNSAPNAAQRSHRGRNSAPSAGPRPLPKIVGHI
jgi:predicted ATP-grasp superfamily ATP-dependent carboligase